MIILRPEDVKTLAALPRRIHCELLLPHHALLHVDVVVVEPLQGDLLGPGIHLNVVEAGPVAEPGLHLPRVHGADETVEVTRLPPHCLREGGARVRGVCRLTGAGLVA